MKKLLLQIAAGACLLLVHGTLGMFLLALYVILTAGVSTANTAKTRAVEQRVAALASTAVQGDGSGNVTISGDLHVDGTLYGVGGTLTIGDTAQFEASGNGPTGSNTFLGMTNSQASFLGNLSQMTGEGSQPTGSDGFGGGVWTANQATSLSTLQSIMNDTVGGLNNLIARLISNGYMA
jgi:hypothetical protein